MQFKANSEKSGGSTESWLLMKAVSIPFLSAVSAVMMQVQMVNTSAALYNFNMAIVMLLIHILKHLVQKGPLSMREIMVPKSRREFLYAFCEAFGGISVGFAVKLFGSLVKDLTAGMSIVMMCFIDHFVYGIDFDRNKIMGTSLVVMSIVSYSVK